MTATLPRPDASVRPMPAHTLSAETEHAIKIACARIAPAWPLDRLIAVNP
jgi:hypothetical protein